jgi:rhamnulokinase
MSADVYVAIDLGAGSGRVLVGSVAASGLRLTEVHRFHYDPRRVAGHLRWDAASLTRGLSTGLRRARDLAVMEGDRLVSVGVDSWAVDYALLDREGGLIEDPICYRDARTDTAMNEVFAVVPRGDVYARTGIQFQPFNTIYQLWAHVREGLPARAAHLLLIPDYCHHWLCGALVSERTNASTTQLLSPSGRWDDDLIGRLGLPRSLMSEVVDAGTRLGTLRPTLCGDLGLEPLSVVAPGTHDTASAVAGTPLEPGWAYISSGTWSLVGVERDAPLISETVLTAGLTNEAGVCGSVRLLTNVMGLWLLESCRREWEREGRGQDLSTLLAAVEQRPESAGVVFPEDRRFFAPTSMVRALRAALKRTGQDDTDDPIRLTKVILDSLALRYASVVAQIEHVTGHAIPGIHIVGGGSLNHYLNQATADASGRDVLAGPVEATAIGNLLVQAHAAGAIRSLTEGRQLIARTFPPTRYRSQNPDRWARVARLFSDFTAHAASEYPA